MFQVILLTFYIVLFTSCGGEEHEAREEKSIYFIDSPTNGIDYYCGKRQGVTKTVTKNSTIKHGVLTCIYSPITLSLGSLYLGTIDNFTDEQKIYPQNLVSSFDGDFNNEEVLKIAILLQSIDDKSDSNFINISKKTKDKIKLTTLKNLTIEELYAEIREMGIIPVTKYQAKLHLILNSNNNGNFKPTIGEFEEDISTYLPVGSIIGKLSIDKGDGTLTTPLSISGEGSKNFMINANGRLSLINTIDTPMQLCKLQIEANSEFGSTTQNITICIEDSGKIGKAQMGRLSNASVKLFKLNPNGSKELIYTTVTKANGGLNQIGNFELKSEELEDHSFYLYEVSGGDDVDIYDSGISDSNSTINLGKLRLLTKGIWVKNAMHKVRVTPLSEMLYLYAKNYSYDELEEKLNIYAKILLKDSLDSDHDIDAKDIMIFDPVNDMDVLYPTLKYNNTYGQIVKKIREGDKSYIDMLFSAYIVESFQANTVEIVGSSVYTVDMLGSGKFCIYNLDSMDRVGCLKLPHAPFEEDTHMLYVNLLNNGVTVSSLSDWSYKIDIKNQKKPLLLNDPFIHYSILSGNFSRLAIGKSDIENIFSRERSLYFYDTSSNGNKKIKFFNIDKENEVLQYEFDSKLLKIDSLWSYQNSLFVIGDSKIHSFSKKNSKMRLSNIYNKKEIRGNIIGVENSVLYILFDKKLTLIDINFIDSPRFIEEIRVPFSYKLGIKTNGKYITTGSKIVDIATLRASNRR